MDELATVVLAAALNSTPLPEPFFERQLRVAPIRLVVPQHRPPLDLDAAIFRYIVSADGTVRVNDDPAGARSCVTSPECRSSRSSSAASRRRHLRRR